MNWTTNNNGSQPGSPAHGGGGTETYKGVQEMAGDLNFI